MRITFFLLLLGLVGCGAQDDPMSQIFADGDDTPKISLSKSFGSQRALTVSSNANGQTAEICKFENGNCGESQDLQYIGEKDGRKFFVFADFSIAAIGSYRVTVSSTQGTDMVRTFEITGAAAGSDGGGAGNWKSVFLAGDYTDNGQAVVVWDNARKEISKLMAARGMSEANMAHLSRDPQHQSATVATASLEGLEQAFQKLKPAATDSCFLFMTSHGSRSSFFIEGGRDISPQDFAGILDQQCGERPTVAIVSACYAGIMLNQQTKKDNRIIFTAASADKTSNGCAPGITYTFFDDCIIKSLNKEAIKTYSEMATDIKSCIDGKENASNASFPQFFIGSKMTNLKIGGSTGTGAGTPPSPIAPDNSGSADATPNANAGTTGNGIAGAANLALQGESGNTNLKAIAGSAKYLLIDFSAPSCSYCLQFAALLEQNKQYFQSGSCKAITMVNPGQLNGWVSRLNSRGASGAAEHAYALTSGSHGQALSSLEGTGGRGGSVPTPTILLFDTTTNKVVSKNVGALNASSLQGFLGSKCGG